MLNPDRVNCRPGRRPPLPARADLGALVADLRTLWTAAAIARARTRLLRTTQLNGAPKWTLPRRPGGARKPAAPLHHHMHFVPLHGTWRDQNHSIVGHQPSGLENSEHAV